MKVGQLQTVIRALRNAIQSVPASLTYKPLDPGSIQIRLFSDAALKNLDKNGSQIGVLVALADRNDKFFVLHWISTRANQTPINAYEYKLLAIVKAFTFHEDYKRVLFELMGRHLPTVYYVENQTCWLGLMNSTQPASLPLETYAPREHVHKHRTVDFVCLIRGKDNPSNALTKSVPNGILGTAIAERRCAAPTSRNCQLQDSEYRNEKYIPTVAVTTNTTLSEFTQAPGLVKNLTDEAYSRLITEHWE